ncbi:MAG: hypothetical protein EBX17_13315 [Betaproteobacteria bacterium]|nr:hypothetical protein [Betaproteobacteria bacterium]
MPDAAHLQVAALQMVSAPDLDHNLLRAEALIAEAAGLGAQLISLPEYFCLLGWRDTDKVALREDFGHGPIQSFLSEMAKRHQVWLAGGTIPLQCEDARRVRNSQLMINDRLVHPGLSFGFVWRLGGVLRSKSTRPSRPISTTSGSSQDPEIAYR